VRGVIALDGEDTNAWWGISVQEISL
jgi:hypothetical protein